MVLSPADQLAIVNAISRVDFESFSARVFAHLHPDRPYHRNWSTKTLHWHLDQIRQGLRRLIIAMPPRTGKSLATSVALVAYLHGLDPTLKVICASYNQELATTLHNDYRRIIKSAWYKHLFPKTRIEGKDTDTHVQLVGGGMRYATSVGGPLTGLGADVIIIDDPLKADDAMSDTMRDRVNSWFSRVMYSRLNDKMKGTIIIVGQRLHMNDLIGHVSGPRWSSLTLPAIAQESRVFPISDNNEHLYRKGEVLDPARETLQKLEEQREKMGSDIFSAQYLQQPVPEGGAMFKRNWIMRYDQPPRPEKGDEIIQAWDCASSEGVMSDYSCCTTWMKRGGLYYLLHVFRGRVDFTTMLKKAIELATSYKPRMVIIEKSSVGPALASQLKRGAGISATTITVRDHKTVRASAQTAKFESGSVYLPKHATWLLAYEDELFAFPGGTHDDQVDATTLALAYERTTAKTTTSFCPV